MNLRIIAIVHGSAAYDEAVALRLEVLRKPLGLHFTTAQLASEREALHYAAYLDGDLVGTAFLLPLDERCVHLRQMAVVPDKQAVGIGAALLAHLEDEARRLGYETITADARVSALGFYLKKGYVASGNVYDHVGLPHRLISKRI